jgi:hypothetical protein
MIIDRMPNFKEVTMTSAGLDPATSSVSDLSCFSHVNDAR